MSFNSIYSAGIQRVAEKAAALRIDLPSNIWQAVDTGRRPATIYHTRLGAALMDHIEDPNIRYVFRLIHSSNTPPDWYSIQYSEVCELERWHNIECAHSRENAIQHIREMAEHKRVTITEEFCEDGSIRILSDTTLIVTMAPIVFSTADDWLVLKAKSILKQFTCIHSEGCLARMLSPLLASRSLHPSCIEQHDESRQYAIYSTLGNLVSSMLRAMERLNVNISRGHAQELLAAFFNVPSWNHLRAIERNCGGVAINPSVVSDHRHDTPIHLYFQDDSHALAFLSTRVHKGHPYYVETKSTYGSIYLRQPPFEWHDPGNHPRSDGEDNAIVMHTLWQVDRYELDPLIPLSQPYEC